MAAIRSEGLGWPDLANGSGRLCRLGLTNRSDGLANMGWAGLAWPILVEVMGCQEKRGVRPAWSGQ